MPHLSAFQWFLAALGGLGIGLSKGGFSGITLVHVLIFAFLFGARDSTGVVLPMLIVGDVLAVATFRRHARWDYIRRLLPPSLTGIALGALLMQRIPGGAFNPVVGSIILVLSGLQALRFWRPDLYENAPHQLWFAWLMGLLAGLTTMLANAAGPIMALFLLAVALPKFELVGTSAWFFLIINCLKVPFSVGLGLIHRESLLFNAALIPFIACGLYGGRWAVSHLPQRHFDGLLLAFAALAALRLIGLF